MPYDKLLTARIRAAISPQPNLEEMKMFGGIGFLVNGNPSTGSGRVMACGVIHNDLIVRVGADAYADALSRPHVKVFDMTGRPMKGWVVVEPEGCTTESDLKAWLERGLAFARSLPEK